MHIHLWTNLLSPLAFTYDIPSFKSHRIRPQNKGKQYVRQTGASPTYARVVLMGSLAGRLQSTSLKPNLLHVDATSSKKLLGQVHSQYYSPLPLHLICCTTARPGQGNITSSIVTRVPQRGRSGTRRVLKQVAADLREERTGNGIEVAD
jgi:hypothetical protein